MSIRRGYWLVRADQSFDGPFQSIPDAQEAAAREQDVVTIQAMVALRRRDEKGKWVTLH